MTQFPYPSRPFLPRLLVMKAVIVPLLCLVIGAVGGVFFSKQTAGDNASGDETKRSVGESTLGSALTGAKSAGGASSSDQAEKKEYNWPEPPGVGGGAECHLFRSCGGCGAARDENH